MSSRTPGLNLGSGGNYEDHTPGEPNDMLYVKFADNYMKKSNYEKALYYIEQGSTYYDNGFLHTVVHLANNRKKWLLPQPLLATSVEGKCCRNKCCHLK